MDSVESRYLSAISRHIGGPIKTAVQNNSLVRHMPGAIRTILCRLIAQSRAAHSGAGSTIEQEWQSLIACETAYESLAAEPPVAPQDAASNGLSPTQQEALIELLRRCCEERSDLAIDSCATVLGGLSKQTILVDLRNNQTLPRQIVLRLDRPESPTDKTVRNEFPLLQLLYDTGIRVPKPWALDATGNVAGQPLMVVSRASGQVIGDGHTVYDTGGGAELVGDLAKELATIHSILIDDLPSSVTGRGRSNLTYA